MVAGGVAACLLVLSGCSSLESTGDKGYISGDGQITQVASAEREQPVTLTGEDLDGDPLDLAEFGGKPVVVTVWGSWCAPCRAEAPDLVEAANELGTSAQFVGINIRDSSTEQANSFVRRFEVPFPSFYSRGGEALLAFQGTLTPRTIPSFVVLDREGRVAASIIGELPSKTTLVQLVEDVIDEGDATDG